MAHGHTSLDDMLRRFDKIASQIAAFAKNTSQSKQNINISVNLGKQLGNAGSASAQARILGKVVNLRMGGMATPGIKAAIGKYHKILGEHGKLRVQKFVLDKKIREMKGKLKGVPKGARAFTGLPQRIKEANQQRRAVISRMNKLRRRATSIMGVAKGKASSQLRLASVVGKLNLAVTALSSAVKLGASVAGTGRQIVGEYGMYSSKGIQALGAQFYGDLRRQMRISSATGQDMLDFTRSWQGMMDKFEPFISKFNSIILKIGTQATGVAGGVAGPLANMLKKFEDWIDEPGRDQIIKAMDAGYKRQFDAAQEQSNRAIDLNFKGLMTKEIEEKINKMNDALARRHQEIEDFRAGKIPAPASDVEQVKEILRKEREAQKKTNESKNADESGFERFRKSLRPGRFRGPFAPGAMEAWNQGFQPGMMPGQQGAGHPVQGGKMNQAQKDLMVKQAETRMDKVNTQMENLQKDKETWESGHSFIDAQGRRHLKMGPDEVRQHMGFMDAQRKLERMKRQIADEIERRKNIPVTGNGPERQRFLHPFEGNVRPGFIGNPVLQA